MSVYAEVWTRPGDASYGRVLDDVPATVQGLHDGVNQFGDGNMTLPDTFDVDSILFIDHLTPANSVSSTVKLFDDSDPTTPIFEWLPTSIFPTGSKDDHLIEVGGDGIKSIVDYGRVDAFDWDGSDDFTPAEPDWIFGGDNLLGNPGFEDSGAIPTIYEVIMEASVTGGTFTLSDGTDTTDPIAFNASAGTVEAELQSDITAIMDVLVRGAGTEDDPWVIEFVNPAFGISLSINDTGLVGGDGLLVLTQEGSPDPSPATKSQVVSTGVPKLHGAYDIFEVSDEQAHTGTFSLKIDPAVVPPKYAGVQWVVGVEPGQLYQASIWVYPTSATDEYRFVMRAPGGNAASVGNEGIFIDSDTGGLGGTSFPANTWSEVTIDDIIIPDGVTSLIFRFANVDQTGNPSIFYVDDAELIRGLRATTAGEILRLLYEQMTDTNLYTTIFWNDEANPGTPYLTLDFTDTVDSGGVPWFETEISMRVWMRMTLKNVLDTLSSDYGIEWRVVPDDVEAGTYLLQAYNPGTMRVDYTSAASPAIQGGSSDVRRLIVRLLPKTDMMVEGLGRLTGRDRDPDLIGALGSIASSRIDRELPELTSVALAAYEDRLNALTDGLTFGYSLVDPQDTPLVDYGLGDLLVVHDPPEVDVDARLVDVTASLTPEMEEWEVQFVPATAQGS